MDTPFLYKVWEPEGIAVVLGSSQKAEKEVISENCKADNVPVLKRRGGGGAVVLMPGVICITVAFISYASPSPYFFFQRINEFIVRVLEKSFNIKGLCLQGSSDIAIRDKKILGCSIFKSRNLFHYQGSLLVNPKLQKIDRYLKHPTREPDYRQNREHLDFVTSLVQSGYHVSAEQVKVVFDKEIANKLFRIGH